MSTRRSSGSRAYPVAALVVLAAGTLGFLSPARAEAELSTSTKILEATATSVSGEVRRANEGMVRVAIKRQESGGRRSIHTDTVAVEPSGGFQLVSDGLAPGTYAARARFLGSPGVRPSRSKPRKFEVAPAPTQETAPAPAVGAAPPDGGAAGPGDTPQPQVESAPGVCPLPSPDEVTSLVALKLPGCPTIQADTASSPDPVSSWGMVTCESDSRHEYVASGGDPHPTSSGTPQGDDGFRRLTVFDGDDAWGERCELGRNDHRYGSGGGQGTFQLYREGERRVTLLSLRLPENFPLDTDAWQTVIQMKQTQPAANGGSVPILEVQVRDGEWILSNPQEDLWSTPAQAGVWTRVAFDVRYSQDPSAGFVKMYVDSNGDGDANDPGEQSPTFEGATLKRETDDGDDSDGIAPGESIPSHLRTGVYHNPEIDCPPPEGCSIDVDNVEVLEAS